MFQKRFTSPPVLRSVSLTGTWRIDCSFQLEGTDWTLKGGNLPRFLPPPSLSVSKVSMAKNPTTHHASAQVPQSDPSPMASLRWHKLNTQSSRPRLCSPLLLTAPWGVCICQWSCLGMVPGQMARIGTTAKKEAKRNVKEGLRASGKGGFPIGGFPFPPNPGGKI